MRSFKKMSKSRGLNIELSRMRSFKKMSKSRGLNIELSRTAEINTSILMFSTSLIFPGYLDFLRVIISSSYACFQCL